MAVWQTDDGAQSPHSHPWLAGLVFAFDRLLRRRFAVLEYSNNPACIFRVQFCPTSRNLVLGDGTRLSGGERVARLHYWNEHLPALRRYQSKLSWAHEFYHRIALSLTELAEYLAARPELADVQVVCADVPSAVQEQIRQITHIMQNFGFETIYDPKPAPPFERLTRFGENILISLMVFVQNPDSVRSDTLRRVRVPIYLSRRTLQRRFGFKGKAAGTAVEAS